MASSSSNVVGVHYRVGKKIGEGSFGVIFEGTNLLNNQQVAIKFVCRPPPEPGLSRAHSFARNQGKVTHRNYEMNTGLTRSWSAAVSFAFAQLSQTLTCTAGIPNVYYFGQEGLHNILVIDLLGPSLEDLFDHCNRRFSIKTVVMVAKQMVRQSAFTRSSTHSS